MVEIDDAAARRAAHVAALRDEREGYARAGKSDRVAAVDAELARAGRPVGRSESPTESKPRTRKP